MGWSYTGSAGGPIVIATLNCPNDAADRASITRTSDRERSIKARTEKSIRILFPLAQSSFASPVLLCGCGLRGVRAETRITAIIDLSHSSRHFPSPKGFSWRPQSLYLPADFPCMVLIL